MTTVRPTLVLALLLGGAGACDNDCARRLETEVRYTGARMGTAYSRQITPRGQARSADTAPANGPTTVGTDIACWQSEGSADEPGWQLEAWIDVDGDDAGPCHENILNLERCRPDPGEPQARMPFTVAAHGPTKIVLELGDP